MAARVSVKPTKLPTYRAASISPPSFPLSTILVSTATEDQSLFPASGFMWISEPSFACVRVASGNVSGYTYPRAVSLKDSFQEEGLMAYLTRRGFIGSLSAAAAASALGAQQKGVPAEKRAGQVAIKITDLRCAIIGKNPVVRIV